MAQAAAPGVAEANAAAGLSLAYGGPDARLGVEWSDASKWGLDGFAVLGAGERHAWLAGGWIANERGGLKLSRHWISADAKLDAPDLTVYKLFAAWDKNEHHQKVTLGAGLERDVWFAGVDVSGGVTGRRLLSQDTDVTTRTLGGTEADGRPYLDTITTTTITTLYERAFDRGLGFTAGRTLDDGRWRLTFGANRYWGDQSARQSVLSAEVAYFIAGTPWSVALQVADVRRTGGAETSLHDTQARVGLRYDFGASAWRRTGSTTLPPAPVQANVSDSAPATVPPAPVASTSAAPEYQIERKIVKVTAAMSSDAFFKIDSAVLTPVAKAELDKVAAVLRATPIEGNVRISGHTCDLGPAAYNLKLSRKRADAVRDYLVAAKVIASDRVVVEGMGEASPKYPNKPATRFKNRRVDIELVTLAERVDEVKVPVAPKAVTPPSAPAAAVPVVTWQAEPIDTMPAWARRALREPQAHDRNVATYRTQQVTATQETSRTYLNRPPVAANDQVSAQAGVPVDIAVLGNDADPDGDALTLVSVSSAAHGTATVSGSAIRYQSMAGYSGTDTFTYVVRDAAGATASASVVVQVTSPEPPPPVNTPPVAKDDTYVVPWTHSSTLYVMDNDSDADKDTLSIVELTQPAYGKVQVVGRAIEFKPNGIMFKNDSFTYTISDGRGGKATATVKLIDP